jgi:hypothetical protein
MPPLDLPAAKRRRLDRPDSPDYPLYRMPAVESTAQPPREPSLPMSLPSVGKGRRLASPDHSSSGSAPANPLPNKCLTSPISCVSPSPYSTPGSSIGVFAAIPNPDSDGWAPSSPLDGFLAPHDALGGSEPATICSTLPVDDAVPAPHDVFGGSESATTCSTLPVDDAVPAVHDVLGGSGSATTCSTLPVDDAVPAVHDVLDSSESSTTCFTMPMDYAAQTDSEAHQTAHSTSYEYDEVELSECSLGWVEDHRKLRSLHLKSTLYSFCLQIHVGEHLPDVSEKAIKQWFEHFLLILFFPNEEGWDDYRTAVTDELVQ